MLPREVTFAERSLHRGKLLLQREENIYRTKTDEAEKKIRWISNIANGMAQLQVLVREDILFNSSLACQMEYEIAFRPVASTARRVGQRAQFRHLVLDGARVQDALRPFSVASYAPAA